MTEPNQCNYTVPFLECDSILLCPLEPLVIEGSYPDWFNEAGVCVGNTHHRFPYTRGEAAEYITSCRGARDRIVLAIVERDSRRHVGNVSLQGIDYISRSSEIAIMIGYKTAWGKGYGTIACRLIIDHAFKELNLERVYCGTFDCNEGMKKIARSLGMVEEGRRRAAVYKNGMYLDVVEFGLLRSEYINPCDA